MYTIISATNRKGSKSLHVAHQYKKILQERGIEAQLVSLEKFDPLSDKEIIIQLGENILLPSLKLLFIVPEYNGSFPGVLKVLIDLLPREVWKNKKAALVGVASGRAGNLRGIEHLMSVLHYIGLTILPQNIYLSKVENLMNEHMQIINTLTLQDMYDQVDAFIQF